MMSQPRLSSFNSMTSSVWRAQSRQCKLAVVSVFAALSVVSALLAYAQLYVGWRVRDATLDRRFAHAVAPPPSAAAGLRNTSSVRYLPSPLEVEWSASARERAGRLCATIEEEAPLWQYWFDAAAAGAPPEPSDAGSDARVWSTLTGVDGLTARLEPLAGFLRDPRTSCRAVCSLQPAISYASEDAKGYIFLDTSFYAEVARGLRAAQARHQHQMGRGDGGTVHQRAPRSLLFDVGSTRWFAAGEGAETGHRGIHWFVDTYARLGLPFDDIYAWEARPTPAAEYFEGMPLDVVARTHFLNLPVRAASGARAGDGTQPDDLIAFIKAAAQPGDFVVVKLDIDSEELEERIVLDILADDAVSALIDDFFFEHHVENAVMETLGWGPAGSHIRDVADSIHLFQALRRRGIRAHSWP